MNSLNKKNLKKSVTILLGASLVVAGIGHLSFVRKDFQAQVPDWVPMSKDNTVLLSGIAEIGLGASLILANKKYKGTVGKVAAVFFTAVFPGNISQYKNRRRAFGLNTDRKRFARLFMQPLLIGASLWGTSK